RAVNVAPIVPGELIVQELSQYEIIVFDSHMPLHERHVQLSGKLKTLILNERHFKLKGFGALIRDLIVFFNGREDTVQVRLILLAKIEV
ncbi:hypothetical protein, partial [Pseudomonas sp. HY7a-MNA-CIBAN-0227]|uniref:hypothetical protein n=1 Tax=Pseudomonas sp. HY7a-MNA-CIBAN-0227 TaxID=3140474 RepID=UPI003321754B